MFFEKTRLPAKEKALPGRAEPMAVPERHFVNGARLEPPFPDGLQRALFGMGCFWGAEKKFWQLPGVYSTAVGYAAGITPNPTYREVCSGMTGHNEVVRVVFDPKQVVATTTLLKAFWENHDPTQGMRQGNDVGTQYRSGIYYFDEAQQRAAEALARRVSAGARRGRLRRDHHRDRRRRRSSTTPRTTTSSTSPRIPDGYCGLGGTGVELPGRRHDQRVGPILRCRQGVGGAATVSRPGRGGGSDPRRVPSCSAKVAPRGSQCTRLRGHRRLPARHHRLRLVLRALPENHPRLFPDRPVGAMVGDLLHDRRHRDEHADVHQRPGGGLRRQHDVPAAGARLHHRPAAGQRAVHPGLLPRRARSRRTSCCSGASARASRTSRRSFS